MSSTILSTKKLSFPQKELLLNAKISFVEYDAIKIDFLDFSLEGNFDYYVFTSQNAVHSFLKNEKTTKIRQRPVLCVGEKTQSILEDNGFKVLEVAKNAAELSKVIIKKYPKRCFLFLTGNLRRNELPEQLTKYNVRYKEVMIYQTTGNKKQFKRQFDKVLFFSPSGVQSFTANNTIAHSMVFCIGSTTAKEALKYTDNVIIANKPTIENVLVQAIKYQNKYD